MGLRRKSAQARHIRLPRSIMFCFVLVTCALLFSATAFSEMPLALNIAPNAFDEASSLWSETGPIFEGEKINRICDYGFTHVYARSAGSTTYLFNLPGEAGPWKANVTVTARLSSEFPYCTAPADGYSDVSLYLNDRWAGTRRVMPDDGRGQMYSWKFPTDLLLAGRNRLQFRVEADAQYQNGVCIYYESVVAGLDDAMITVLIEPGIAP